MRREPPVRIREGLGVKFPRATRLVILCRSPEDAARALAMVQQWTADAGLTLHPDKTKIVDATVDRFDFLGYRFERGRRYPRPKSMQKLKETIRAQTKRTSGKSLQAIISALTPTLRGWFEYFCLSRYSGSPAIPAK
jgi:RNA-directed DNA polymerase